jgi:hypothetical protein
MNRRARGCPSPAKRGVRRRLRYGTNTVEVLVVIAMLGLIGLIAWRLLLQRPL